MISPSVPADGAGTSIVTLSVSSSTKGSSTATASPAFLNQRPMVASVTDSPSVGTRISVMAWFPLASWPGLSWPYVLKHSSKNEGACPAFAGHDELRFPLVQRLVQESLELRQVLGHQTGGR